MENIVEDQWLNAIIFEHACKKKMESVLQYFVKDESACHEITLSGSSDPHKKPSVSFVFTHIYLLKRFQESLLQERTEKWRTLLPPMLELLESIYRQFSFLSMKKFFTLITEMKLLDLLNTLTATVDQRTIIEKLNKLFPRWTPEYAREVEKRFCVKNPKVLSKVGESHAQCRRQFLRLSVDAAYRAAYLSAQYATDFCRIVEECGTLVGECIAALEMAAGPTTLEKVLCSGADTDAGTTQVLQEYLQPDASEETLLQLLQEGGGYPRGLLACLRPFDALSQISRLESSDSEWESCDEMSGEYT